MPDVPIPYRMKHLPLDKRGYPIPVGVWRDSNGTPHFTINEESRRITNLYRHLCPICGMMLFRGCWFVGGPGSAFHKMGCYIDPPMHKECMDYALQVCPYLAAPYYSKRIDARLVPKKDKEGRLFVDNTVDPNRPAVFVAVMSVKTSVFKGQNGSLFVKPIRPYRSVEYWRYGKQITASEAMALGVNPGSY